MRYNKPIAGYHMLMILSAVDNKFTSDEDSVIQKWMEEQFPFFINLDKEVELLSEMNPEYYMAHFQKCMDDFYNDSNEKERNELIQFALNLVNSDNKITKKENIYIDELFNKWTDETI